MNISHSSAGATPRPSIPTRSGDGLTTQMAWRVAAALFAITAVGCMAQLASGAFGDSVQNPWIVVALSALALTLAPIWWICGERDVDGRWLHAGMLTSYAILSSVLQQSPIGEAHMGIAYLVPLIFSALFLSSRAVFFYIGLSVAFIAYSVITHAAEPYGVIAGMMTTAALVTTVCLTLYVRLQLDSIGRQAAFLSGRDELTGLANLRPLYERIEKLIDRAKRGEDQLSVIMLDLEGFKQVNDRHSHSVGDETLRAVARALRQSARRNELVARRGGDEFAIVSNSADVDEIEMQIERIEQAVDEARRRLLPTEPTGITSGFAIFEPGDNVSRLIARADRSLAAVKSARSDEAWLRRSRRWRDFDSESDF